MPLPAAQQQQAFPPDPTAYPTGVYFPNQPLPTAVTTNAPRLTPPNNLFFKQGGASDCFFLAVVDKLSRHPQGTASLKKLVRQIDKDTWILRFPTAPHVPFKVTREELEQNQGWKSVAQGPLGVNILEVGYQKLKKYQNPTKFADLLTQSGKSDYLDENLGHMAFADLTGWKTGFIMAEPGVIQEKSKSFKAASQTNPTTRLMVEQVFAQAAAHPDTFLLTACTQQTDDHRLLNKEKEIAPFHDYAIRHIDPQARTVTLANPWDNRNKVETLTYDEFMDYYCYVAIAMVPPRVPEGMPQETFQSPYFVNPGNNRFIN